MDRRLGRRANRRMRECRGGLEGIIVRALSLREELSPDLAVCHCRLPLHNIRKDGYFWFLSGLFIKNPWVGGGIQTFYVLQHSLIILWIQSNLSFLQRRYHCDLFLHCICTARQSITTI